MLTTRKIVTTDELEDAAKGLLEKPIFDFIAGGAGREWGLANNKNAFNNYFITPRILQDVSSVNTTVEILGHSIVSPVIIAPCAFHKLVYPEGELATIKAAGEVGTIMTLSTMSSYSIEEVSKASDSPRWFQLYVFKDRSFTKELVKRAEQSGYSALIVTVDVPEMGRRFRDIKNQFSLPDTIEAANLKKSSFSLSEKTQGSAIKEQTDKQFDAALTWTDIDWLHSITKLPILLKGVLSPVDASEALNHRVSGIIVSNHGGRQIDSAIPAIEALPHIAKVIKNKIPILVDGGITTGEDIFKAIALGADAVMIGRPILWSLAINGKKEVVATLKRFNDELASTMRLAGCKSLKILKESGLSYLSGPGTRLMQLEENTEKTSKVPLKKSNLWKSACQ